MSNQQRNKGVKLITVLINGIAMKIDPNTISKEKRTVLHGEYKGTKVDSPAICEVGDSVVFWPNAKKPFAVSMSKPEFGVLATKFLEAEGATVIEKA